MSKQNIRIAIVDDHPMVVAGLIAILKPYPHISIEATYSNASELLTGLRSAQPDVLILDVSLPDQTAKELLPVLVPGFPDMRILILTSLDAPALVNSMMRRGSQGYLLKGAGAATLVQAIETVYQRETFLDPALKETLFKNVMNYKNSLSEQPLIPKLSQREKEILRLIANEYTTKEIAEKLFIGYRTAENHRYNLLQKLDVKNTSGLVKLAIHMGLI